MATGQFTIGEGGIIPTAGGPKPNSNDPFELFGALGLKAKPRDGSTFASRYEASKPNAAPAAPTTAQPVSYNTGAGQFVVGPTDNAGNPQTGPGAPAPAAGGSTSSTSTKSTSGILGNPTAWNITGQQTVAGQLKALTDPNSALQQQARTQGMKTAASRGLLNSSMAATAGEDAWYRAVTPIATADAETYGKAAGYNADQSNQFAVVNANNATSLQQAQMQIEAQARQQAAQNASAMEQARLQSETSKYTAQLSAENQRAISEMNNASQMAVSKLNNEAQAMMNAEAERNKQILQASSFAANAFNNYASAMANIQVQPSMDEDTKRDAINNLQNEYKAAMQTAYKLHNAGIPDLSAFLDWSKPDPEDDPSKPGGGRPGKVDPLPPPTYADSP